MTYCGIVSQLLGTEHGITCTDDTSANWNVELVRIRMSCKLGEMVSKYQMTHLTHISIRFAHATIYPCEFHQSRRALIYINILYIASTRFKDINQVVGN